MMHVLSNVLVGGEAGSGDGFGGCDSDANLREGAGVGTWVFSVNWVYREVTGVRVIVIVIVSPPSLNTSELSMVGRNPQQEPPGGESFNEGGKGDAVGMGWLMRGNSITKLNSYMYGT